MRELNISPTSLAAGYHSRTDLNSFFFSFWRIMRFASKPLKYWMTKILADPVQGDGQKGEKVRSVQTTQQGVEDRSELRIKCQYTF